MPAPRRTPPVARGELTPAQHEIMGLVWEAGEAGLTVADIWQAIAARRDVGRTTTLNLVDRLEKRGWLRRAPAAGGYRYTAAIDRATSETRLASSFVSNFFGGSPAQLVQSLLGAEAISPREIERLRRLLDAARKP